MTDHHGSSMEHHGGSIDHHGGTVDHHGGSVERTFAALPPARGRGLARTWWGQSWLKALEDTALDGEQLKKGRRYARNGAVGAVSVRPGRITAVVRDRDRTPYRSDVLLRELSADDWDRLLDTAADRAGHIAALLDRDMPPHLAEDAAAVGVELLPGIGDLEPECTCVDAWDHCGHTAALGYQVARLLDQDPFVLLLVRGRGKRELLAELQVRSVARAARDPEEQPQAEEAEEVKRWKKRSRGATAARRRALALARTLSRTACRRRPGRPYRRPPPPPPFGTGVRAATGSRRPCAPGSRAARRRSRRWRRSGPTAAATRLPQRPSRPPTRATTKPRPGAPPASSPSNHWGCPDGDYRWRSPGSTPTRTESGGRILAQFLPLGGPLGPLYPRGLPPSANAGGAPMRASP
jgi:uncharacterized Zn finger protein